MQEDYKTEMRAMTKGLAEWCRRRERRGRTARTLIGAATVAVIVTIIALPDPDGLYFSNVQARTATLHIIDQTALIAKP